MLLTKKKLFDMAFAYYITHFAPLQLSLAKVIALMMFDTQNAYALTPDLFTTGSRLTETTAEAYWRIMCGFGTAQCVHTVLYTLAESSQIRALTKNSNWAYNDQKDERTYIELRAEAQLMRDTQKAMRDAENVAESDDDRHDADIFADDDADIFADDDDRDDQFDAGASGARATHNNDYSNDGDFYEDDDRIFDDALPTGKARDIGSPLTPALKKMLARRATRDEVIDAGATINYDTKLQSDPWVLSAFMQHAKAREQRSPLPSSNLIDDEATSERGHDDYSDGNDHDEDDDSS